MLSLAPWYEAVTKRELMVKLSCGLPVTATSKLNVTSARIASPAP